MDRRRITQIPIGKIPIFALGRLVLAARAVVLHPVLPIFQEFLVNDYDYLLITHLWRYPVILTAVVVKGPIATLLGGAWVALGWVDFWLVLSVAMLAGLLADTVWYYVGYFGREQVLERGDAIQYKIWQHPYLAKMLLGYFFSQVDQHFDYSDFDCRRPD